MVGDADTKLGYLLAMEMLGSPQNRGQETMLNYQKMGSIIIMRSKIRSTSNGDPDCQRAMEVVDRT